MITSITVRTNLDTWGADPTAEEIQRFEDAARAACATRWPDASVSIEHLDTYGWFIPLEIETDGQLDAEPPHAYGVIYAAVFDAVDRAFEYANRATPA